jgi:hypothetical protein
MPTLCEDVQYGAVPGAGDISSSKQVCLNVLMHDGGNIESGIIRERVGFGKMELQRSDNVLPSVCSTKDNIRANTYFNAGDGQLWRGVRAGGSAKSFKIKVIADVEEGL